MRPVAPALRIPLATLCLTAAACGSSAARSPPGAAGSALQTARVATAGLASPLAPARRITSGEGFDCAIASSGQLYCWIDGEAPRALSHFERTSALSGHARPGCAVREDGTLACFMWVDAIGGPGIVFVDSARYAWRDIGLVSRVASPCVIVAADRSVECLLPEDPEAGLLPRSLGLEEDRERPRIRLDVRGARDLASSTMQVCVLDEVGSVWCFRVGRRPTRIEGLPPLRSIAMGNACRQIVCGLAEDDELVCFTTLGPAGSVRIPGVRDVAIEGCTVCMASLDGRVACFGSADDRAPFETSPRLIVGLEGVAQLALGPEHGCALTEDERVVCFDPSGGDAAQLRDVSLPPHRGRAP